MKGEGQSMCLYSNRHPATETINFAGGIRLAEHSPAYSPSDWDYLIRNRKLGYLALLHNLSSILTSVPHLINEVLDMLVEENSIKRSLVSPSDFLSAMEAIEDDPPPGVLRVLAALSDAMEVSRANVPALGGKGIVPLDHSWRMMRRPISIGISLRPRW